MREFVLASSLTGKDKTWVRSRNLARKSFFVIIGHFLAHLLNTDKAWFPYDLKESATSAITICDQSALRRRHMKTLFSSVGDDLRHAVGTVERVESSSTFPIITTVPTKTIFNGNVYLRWSGTIVDTLLLFQRHVLYIGQSLLRSTIYYFAGNKAWRQQANL